MIINETWGRELTLTERLKLDKLWEELQKATKAYYGYRRELNPIPTIPLKYK